MTIFPLELCKVILVVWFFVLWFTAASFWSYHSWSLKWKSVFTFLLAESFDFFLLLFFLLEFDCLDMKIRVVNFTDFFYVQHISLSSLTLFFLFFAYSCFGLDFYQLSFLHLFFYLLNVFLLDFFVLFSNSFFKIFKLLFLLFFFPSLLFLFKLYLFLYIKTKTYQRLLMIKLFSLLFNLLQIFFNLKLIFSCCQGIRNKKLAVESSDFLTVHEYFFVGFLKLFLPDFLLIFAFFLINSSSLEFLSFELFEPFFFFSFFEIFGIISPLFGSLQRLLV